MAKNYKNLSDEIDRKKQKQMEEDESMLQQLDGFFMVKHPPELITFWRHAVQLDAKNPLDAFSELDWLSLVGPFQFIAKERNKTKNDDESVFLKLAFAVDLPKMETIFLHRGGRFCYWRDVPDQMPNILVHVADGDGEQHFPTVTICGERDLFAALQYLLRQQQLTATKTKKQSNAASSSGTKSEKFAHLFPNNYDMTTYGPDYLKMLKKRNIKKSIGKPCLGIGNKVPINDKCIDGIGTKVPDKKVERREKFKYKFSWVKLTICAVLLIAFSVLLWITFNPADKICLASSTTSKSVNDSPFWLSSSHHTEKICLIEMNLPLHSSKNVKASSNTPKSVKNIFWLRLVMDFVGYSACVFAFVVLVYGIYLIINVNYLLHRFNNDLRSLTTSYERSNKKLEEIHFIFREAKESYVLREVNAINRIAATE